MERPVCPACNQRFRAVNYTKDSVTHYRSRCESCIKRGRRIKVPEPRWKASGYKKKATCDKCGFKGKHSAQLLVYHVDGNLNNSNLRNLKTICLNCVEEVKRADLPWRAGDLTPDL
jgi:hypothetical protein